MAFSIAAILLSSNLVIVAAAAADRIPEFNVDPGCRAVADADIGGRRTMEHCKRDQQEARDQLGKQWPQFPAADKDRCTRLSSLGGVASYVELLTCLEIARDVRNLREQKNTTTGQGR